jgi:hypothetical protein
MSFPIIGTQSVWDNWAGFGFGSWQMWFHAAYGSWIYAGYVKSNTPVFKKIDIGSADPDYEIIDWDFGVTPSTPESMFPYELHEGYPDGAIGCGCIREDAGAADAFLYLIGRSDPAPNPATVLRRFSVNNNFEEEAGLPTLLAYTTAAVGDVIAINHVAGLEVKPGSDVSDGIFLLTNNRSGRDFELRKYTEDGIWDGAPHAPDYTVALSPVYMENNTLARLRGIGHAADGNILVFINSGLSSTATKVLKFNSENLNYMGQTTWQPSLASSSWAYVIQSSEVFMLFRDLDSANTLDWKTAIYYDRATGIPDATKSNFIVENNLTSFGSEEAVELKYIARDSFNIPVTNVATKFVVDGENELDPSSWNDRVGGIQDLALNDFFDSQGVPLAISAVVNTDAVDGIAIAYYKPMRTGSGTETDAVNVFCPST